MSYTSFPERKTWGGGRKVKGCKTSFTRHPETENSAYDEKVHKRTVDLVPTADLRTALEAVSVKVLGAKESSARIASVTDSATGLNYGTLTIGDDIIIEGEKLKIYEKDSRQGVFFAMEDGTEIKTTHRLPINRPSQMVARVPKSLAAGPAKVIVRTRYSAGAVPLKELREIVFGYPCMAKA